MGGTRLVCSVSYGEDVVPWIRKIGSRKASSMRGDCVVTPSANARKDTRGVIVLVMHC